MTRANPKPQATVTLPRHLVIACREVAWLASVDSKCSPEFRERADRVLAKLDEYLLSDDDPIAVKNANTLSSFIHGCPKGTVHRQAWQACDVIREQLAGKPEAKPPDPEKQLAIAAEAKRLREEGVVLQGKLL
jgi:hypothetical protein